MTYAEPNPRPSRRRCVKFSHPNRAVTWIPVRSPVPHCKDAASPPRVPRRRRLRRRLRRRGAGPELSDGLVELSLAPAELRHRRRPHHPTALRAWLPFSHGHRAEPPVPDLRADRRERPGPDRHPPAGARLPDAPRGVAASVGGRAHDPARLALLQGARQLTPRP